MNKKGFTLIEILVALAVFSVMAVIAYEGLRRITDTREQLTIQQEKLKKLTRAVGFLERDLRAIVARSVRGNYGEPVATIVGNADQIEFTRSGFANPQFELRSNLERVIYRLDQQQLQRSVYPVLDRAPGSTLRITSLMEKMHSFRLRYLDDTQHWSDVWPPPRSERLELLPRAIEFHLEVSKDNEITRLIELPSTPLSISADAPFAPPSSTHTKK